MKCRLQRSSVTTTLAIQPPEVSTATRPKEPLQLRRDSGLFRGRLTDREAPVAEPIIQLRNITLSWASTRPVVGCIYDFCSSHVYYPCIALLLVSSLSYEHAMPLASDRYPVTKGTG
jgi:hypothetical protein